MKVDAFPKTLRDPARLLRALKTKKESYWLKRGQKRALTLFHQMATHVPAYKDFLKKHNIHSHAINGIQDIQQIPTIDKDNYLRKYPLESLCWEGKLKQNSWTIAATSGSTGEPFYFPRQHAQDLQYATTAELYLLNNFQIDKKTTLYINGFGMGIWIGGVFTYQAIRLVANRGSYPLTIMTPGSSKQEIINAVKYLGKKFDQIIIGGYPPLVKDTIDEGIRKGIKWKQYNLHFVFSAEGFSEAFRDYIITHAGVKNPYTGTLNHYGTVDLGTMSHETPVCILIRKIASQKPKLAQVLFGNETRLPTLTQFIPEMFYFETVNNTLACSAYSGIPLFRYSLKDTGNVLTLKEITKILKDHGISLTKELTDAHIYHTLWNLPFVYVFERSDFTVKLSGANIYPEEIRRALQQPIFHKSFTGKFTMIIKFDKHQDQFLEINIEMQRGIKPSTKISTLARETIMKELCTTNSEYCYLSSLLPLQRLTPHVVLCQYEDPTHFLPGGKQKWVKQR